MDIDFGLIGSWHLSKQRHLNVHEVFSFQKEATRYLDTLVVVLLSVVSIVGRGSFWEYFGTQSIINYTRTEKLH